MLKTDKLSMLMRGTLDLSSHRLDAWVTSFATKRLKTMRQKDPAGVYLGGYGWLEDLQPGPPRTEVNLCRPANRARFSDSATTQASSMRPRSISRNGGSTAKRASHPFWPHARSKCRSACDRSFLRTRTHGAISAGWRAIRSAARRPAGVSLRARPARARTRCLHRCVPPIVPIKSTRVDETGQGGVCPGDPCCGWSNCAPTKQPADRVTLFQFASTLAKVPVPPIMNVEVDALAQRRRAERCLAGRECSSCRARQSQPRSRNSMHWNAAKPRRRNSK